MDTQKNAQTVVRLIFLVVMRDLSAVNVGLNQGERSKYPKGTFIKKGSHDIIK